MAQKFWRLTRRERGACPQRSVTGEQRRQPPKEPARRLKLFFYDVLKSLVTLAILLQALHTSLLLAAQTDGALSYLTNAAQIRTLSVEDAQRGYPVKLQGVVLYADPQFNDLIIQDDTAGIYVRGWSEQFGALHPGQLVQLAGVSGPGDYAPVVTVRSLTLLGEGTVPAAPPVSYGDLASGLEDGQWIETGGIVLSATLSTVRTNFIHQYLIIQMLVGGNELTARVLNFTGADIDHLPDAELRVRGVTVPMFSTHHQLYSEEILVSSLADVQIIQPQPASPFGSPASPINSLFQFSPTKRLGHRVKVAGVVLLQRPGEIYVKDDTQGICVFTAQTTPVVPGDRVEVLGFPAHGDFSPVLRDAVFRKTGTGPAPSPTPVTAEQASSGIYSDDLLQMDATLLNNFRYGGEEILVLEQSNLVFNVHLPNEDRAREPAAFAEGSLLRVTGICEIHLDNWRQSFQLLSRSPADVLVLRPPPWWNLRHTLWVVGFAAALVALAFFGVVSHSRRRLHAHLTARREAEAEFAAVSGERNRLAGELHDTLEQALVGVAMQLEAATKTFSSMPQTASRHLDAARQMVDQSQNEVHRSIWNLRSQMLDNNDLASALDALSKQLSTGADIQVTMEVLGAKRRLPDFLENHLLRIAQEAIANAIKHGRPRRIEVQLVFEPVSMALTVRDDGCGFDAGNPPANRNSHFGLSGMRERARAVNGNIEVESTRGRGTMITVEVPCK
jgi:signal transduction histidine kinase